MQLGIIGSGSWATALAKIFTDNKQSINWCVRYEEIVNHLQHRHHNPGYLSSVYFDTNLLNLGTDIAATIAASDCILIAVPSAYVIPSLSNLPANAFEGKKVISAVKGILPDNNLLLNEYLKDIQPALIRLFHGHGPLPCRRSGC